MTRQDAIDELNALKDSTDNEHVHAAANGILLEFLRSSGYAEVANAYDELSETVNFWYA